MMLSKSACVNLVFGRTYPVPMMSGGVDFMLTDMNSTLEEAGCGISSIGMSLRVAISTLPRIPRGGSRTKVGFSVDVIVLEFEYIGWFQPGFCNNGYISIVIV